MRPGRTAAASWSCRRERLVVGAGQQVAVGHQADGAEQQPRDRQLHGARDTEIDRAGAHQAAEHRTRRPDRMQRVDDEPPVVPLHPQAVHVLRDVGDRVGRPRAEQRRRHGDAGGGEPGAQGEHRDQDAARDRDHRGAEPPDQRRRRRTGQQGSGGERGHRETEDRVRQAQVGLDLRETRQQVGEQRPVGQEQPRRCDPGPAVTRLERWAAHVRRRYARPRTCALPHADAVEEAR